MINPNDQKHYLKEKFMMMKWYVLVLMICLSSALTGQTQYFGADLSYVNEIEDCGVQYFEEGIDKDPYTIFADHQCNLVRLRLWHTPKWYDDLNSGHRYSDLNDVKKSIGRAKQNGMQVLLDFHLSDNWADPSKQLVPEAWLAVVDDLEILQDSLYQYIHGTLQELYQEDLLPEMIQIGNETNKGILLSPEDNETWTLDWERNAALFNTAIDAVNDFEEEAGEEVIKVLHIAGPDDVEWFVNEFEENGVVDFDIIGISYYWAWHQPTTIAEVGETIQSLLSKHPGKEVMVVETGYVWTQDYNDSANNIINNTNVQYDPTSPENQKLWLTDLARTIFDAGGIGMIYWEPAWLSSSCFTQWGQGSHQENACFFDFENELLLPGGIEWMSYEYGPSIIHCPGPEEERIVILKDSFANTIIVQQHFQVLKSLKYEILDSAGKKIQTGTSDEWEFMVGIEHLPKGVYFIAFTSNKELVTTEKFSVN